MTWNYRVVRKDGLLSIREAYYDDEAGAVKSLSVKSVSPDADAVEELRSALVAMIAALDKPVVVYEEVGD